jgi:hypothetical protein
MPICDACGEVVETVYECGECGGLYCGECGDPKMGTCVYCAEETYEEDVDEDTGVD